MILDANKMCFTTVANGSYQQYIPWWLYFLDQAYPESHKMIFLDRHIEENIEEILSILPFSFVVKENAFDEYGRVDGETIKCLRWLMFDPVFELFDCLSIGDVDMAICKEFPSYMQQHLSHCELLDIPYSNCIRASSGPNRMGGIHVVKPKEWFKIMMPVIDKYRSELIAGELGRRVPKIGAGFNERFLLQMILESDLGEIPKNLSDTYWSFLTTSAHHGVHIRLAELGIDNLKKSRGYSFRKSEFLAACQSSLFDELVIKSPKIGSILRQVMKSYGA
ncbi:hypothetical protein LCGC14_0141870 [marine sediment metagenome]|uniref:Uncharacterized protein n=1 Tax=marine sediment metagenome TaxID=412755 RepID=A0A0F9VGI5_9ZZZZ